MAICRSAGQSYEGFAEVPSGYEHLRSPVACNVRREEAFQEPIEAEKMTSADRRCLGSQSIYIILVICAHFLNFSMGCGIGQSGRAA